MTITKQRQWRLVIKAKCPISTASLHIESSSSILFVGIIFSRELRDTKQKCWSVGPSTNRSKVLSPLLLSSTPPTRLANYAAIFLQCLSDHLVPGPLRLSVPFNLAVMPPLPLLNQISKTPSMNLLHTSPYTQSPLLTLLLTSARQTCSMLATSCHSTRLFHSPSI